MRRSIFLLPLLALLGCPNSQRVHLVTDAAPQGGTMRCTVARMTSLGYTLQDTTPTEMFRVRSGSKREGNLETVLTARLFVYEQTGVRRLAVLANQVDHSAGTPAQIRGVSRQARADAEALIDACGVAEPARQLERRASG
jgi:hypothetical protein